MSTSWQVKAKYNSKAYRSITVQLKKELVEQWEDKLKETNMGKSEFIRNAIISFLEGEG